MPVFHCCTRPRLQCLASFVSFAAASPPLLPPMPLLPLPTSQPLAAVSLAQIPYAVYFAAELAPVLAALDGWEQLLLAAATNDTQQLELQLGWLRQFRK